MRTFILAVLSCPVAVLHAQEYPACTDMTTLERLWMPSILEQCCDPEDNCADGFPASCDSAW